MKLLPEVSLCVNVINSVTTNLAYCVTLSALSGQVGTCTQCNDIRTPMAMNIRFVTAYKAWCTTHGNSNCCRNSHKIFARASKTNLKKNFARAITFVSLKIKLNFHRKKVLARANQKRNWTSKLLEPVTRKMCKTKVVEEDVRKLNDESI